MRKLIGAARILHDTYFHHHPTLLHFKEGLKEISCTTQQHQFTLMKMNGTLRFKTAFSSYIMPFNRTNFEAFLAATPPQELPWDEIPHGRFCLDHFYTRVEEDYYVSRPHPYLEGLYQLKRNPKGLWVLHHTCFPQHSNNLRTFDSPQNAASHLFRQLDPTPVPETYIGLVLPEACNNHIYLMKTYAGLHLKGFLKNETDAFIHQHILYNGGYLP